VSIANDTETVPSELKVPSAVHYAVRPYRLAAKIFHWVTALLIVFMVASGITMKQLGSGAAMDFIFTLHKTTGALIVVLVLGRFLYRVAFPDRSWKPEHYRRPYLHWLLYTLLIVVPLLGWAGISDFGARGIFFGLSLPSIWPEGAGWADFLFESHAYAAFGMLVVVALHIGMAVQDHMTRSRWETAEED
jgi:cytochrome b561